MNIGIDLTSIWRPGTGIFLYAKNLARELLIGDKENRYTLFFGREVHPEFNELRDRFRSVVVPVRGELTSKQVFMAMFCNMYSLDLIHFPAFPPPIACLRPFIWTLHDAIPWLYPETMDMKGRMYFQLIGRRAVRSSRLILTVSEKSKHDIVHSLGVPEDKVKVVYVGVGDAFRRVEDPDSLALVRAQYNLPERFILSVATLEARKNLPALIRAYRSMRRAKSTELGLVLAGRSGWKTGNLQEEADCDQVTVTGFVPQQHLVALYNLAEMFVLPSLYEGFGSPPLEAMACGCPVIVSNRGALPEAVGDAALLIDPEREQSIVDAIRTLESNPSLRLNLINRGFARAKGFSWKNTARHTAELYRKALSTSPGNDAQDFYETA